MKHIIEFFIYRVMKKLHAAHAERDWEILKFQNHCSRSQNKLTSRTRFTKYRDLWEKKTMTEYLLICTASEETANDKNLGRANFLKPLPEFTKKEWLWWIGTEKSSNLLLSSLVITFTENWWKKFIWYLMQSLVLDTPPSASAYRRTSSSQVVYMIMFIWLYD